MANKLPKFLTEFITYSRLVKRKQGFRKSVASYMERSKILIGDAYDVDYDRVVDIFLREWDKSEKDYPSPSIISPQNIKEFDLFNQYSLYLWEYYVVNASQEPPKPKSPPKVPEVKKPKVEEPPQVESEGEFEGYGDEDDMVSMGDLTPRALKLYDGVTEEDLVGEDVDERILKIIGEEDAIDIDYGTYQSLLKEEVIKSTLGKSTIAREEEMLLAEEFKRIKGKVGRFKINKKRINTGSGSATAPLKQAKNFITGAPEEPQKLLPPATAEKKQRKASLAENISAIRKTCDSILKLMEGQYAAIRKQLQSERKLKENTRRANRESGLESGIKKTMATARRVLAPVFDLLGKIINFLGTVLLGRVLVLLVDWLAKKENQKKIQSLIRFIGDWWPALLAGYLLFFNPIGRLVRTVLGTIAKLTLTIAKKGIPKLLRLIKSNPIASAVVLGSIGAFGGAYFASQRNDKLREEQNAKDDAGTVTPAETKATGQIPSGSQLLGEQIGQRGMNAFSGGGKIAKKTLPRGGKVKGSTGKRVRGAGKDTQMIIAQPGEVVISKKAVDNYGAPFFLDLNKAGGGTNKPQWAPFGNIMTAQGGGLIPIDVQREASKRGRRTSSAIMDDNNHPEHTKAVNNEPGFTLDDYVQRAVDELMKQGWRKPVDSMTDYEKSWNTDRNLMPDLTSLSIPSKPIAGDMTGSESGYQRRVNFRRSQNSYKSPKVKPNDSGGEMMGPPESKQITPNTTAAFTGVMPKQNNPKSAPSKKPIAMLASGGTMTAPPPPPSPKVNIMSMDKKMDRPKRTGSSASGNRDIEHFLSYQQNESRMMNISIYGLMGVE